MIQLKNNFRKALIVGTAGGIALLIGQSSVLVTPVILSSLIRGLELSATNAGFLVTLEMLTLAVSTLVLASYIGGISKTRMFMAGLIALIIGQLVSALIDIPAFILLGRVLVGLGGGMMVTVINATLASSEDPERFFAIAYVTSALFTAFVIILLTELSNQYNHVGVFVFLAAMAVIGTAFCKPIYEGQYIGTSANVISLKNPALAYLTLFAIFIYYCGAGSAWAFAEQIGHHIKIDSGTIGLILSGVTLGGLVGGSVAAWLSTRAGRIKPLVACATIQVFSILLLSVSTTTLQYLVALMIATISLYLIMPYLIGVAAMFGENGRWGAAGGGASLLGLALSPVVGGILVDWGGYKIIGIAFAVLAPLSILILVFVIIQYSKSEAIITNPATGGI